jgi:hypothetical protein
VRAHVLKSKSEFCLCILLGLGNNNFMRALFAQSLSKRAFFVSAQTDRVHTSKDARRYDIILDAHIFFAVGNLSQMDINLPHVEQDCWTEPNNAKGDNRRAARDRHMPTEQCRKAQLVKKNFQI